ncbi:hypothetical protein G3A43_06130 [Paraburkholderia aspalathi]|nr:hypothetical protein [Paraburkholderia aspalathi]MBK3779825.1 hypothetical protein [Paraburkholderia aspalathi]
MQNILRASGITDAEYSQITQVLREDYPDSEIQEDLANAKVIKDDAGVTVIYGNGARDRYVYTKVLVHEQSTPAPVRTTD